MYPQKGIGVAVVVFAFFGTLWRGIEKVETTEYIINLPTKPLVRELVAFFGDSNVGGFFLGFAVCALIIALAVLRRRSFASGRVSDLPPQVAPTAEPSTFIAEEEEETRTVKKRRVVARRP